MQRAEQHRLRVAVKARASGVSQCFKSEEELSGGKQHGDQVQSLLSRGGVEVSGWWIDDRRKPVPEWVTGVAGVFLRLPSGWLCNMASLCSSWLPPPLRKNGKRGEKGALDGHSGNSEGSDVIERVVQLLTDGLVLHLLCIDFIWGVRRGGGR